MWWTLFGKTKFATMLDRGVGGQWEVREEDSVVETIGNGIDEDYE